MIHLRKTGTRNAIAACALAAAFASSAPAASLVGTVKVGGARDSKDAVVYVDQVPKENVPPPTKEEPLMDQKGLTFIPHILPVQAGTTVKFHNSDDVRHNVFSPSAAGDKFNFGAYPKGEVRKKTFDKVGEVVCLCNVHAEMSAYILVLQNPYFAVTDKEGNYKIANLPAGTYQLKVWHEKFKKPQSKEIKVAQEETQKTDFELKR